MFGLKKKLEEKRRLEEKRNRKPPRDFYIEEKQRLEHLRKLELISYETYSIVEKYKERNTIDYDNVLSLHKIIEDLNEEDKSKIVVYEGFYDLVEKAKNSK